MMELGSRRFLLVITACLYFFEVEVSFSQNIERQVCSAAGRDAKNNSVFYQSIKYMTYTIGEPVIYGAATNTNRLNNGFIQPKGIIPATPPAISAFVEEDNNHYLVYPNPFTGEFVISSPDSNRHELIIQIIDSQGKLIFEKTSAENREVIVLPENCSEGIYWLNLYKKDGEFLQQDKLIKNGGSSLSNY
jgi:hypothetical protein